MIIKNKTTDSISPYCYLLKFKINNDMKFYYGVRYGNVRLGLSPSNDLFKKYFTSSNSVSNLLKDGIFPFEIVIHKTFKSNKDACDFEVRFLSRVFAKERFDFLNQTNSFNNSLPYLNRGRIVSKETRDKIGKLSKINQSNDEYKLKKSKLMKEKWSEPLFIEKMKIINNEYWNSPEGSKQKEKVSKNWIGKTHKQETIDKMKISAKLACATKIDCVGRAMNRQRYICPICSKNNLDGGNFNKHMVVRHFWDKSDCDDFKCNYEL